MLVSIRERRGTGHPCPPVQAIPDAFAPGTCSSCVDCSAYSSPSLGPPLFRILLTDRKHQCRNGYIRLHILVAQTDHVEFPAFLGIEIVQTLLHLADIPFTLFPLLVLPQGDLHRIVLVLPAQGGQGIPQVPAELFENPLGPVQIGFPALFKIRLDKLLACFRTLADGILQTGTQSAVVRIPLTLKPFQNLRIGQLKRLGRIQRIRKQRLHLFLGKILRTESQTGHEHLLMHTQASPADQHKAGHGRRTGGIKTGHDNRGHTMQFRLLPVQIAA